MSILTFNRYERKYVLDQNQYDKIKAVLDCRLERDSYSDKNAYSIYNIYFDSASDESVRESLRKPYYKEKIRLRTYKLYPDQVFLEAKRKVGKIVYKRRIAMTSLEADNLIYKKEIPVRFSSLEKQIANELIYAIEQKGLYPKVFLSYDRLAYFDKQDKSFRLTIDSNIKYRYQDVSFDSDNYGLNVLENGKYIMEIKFINSIPLWMVELLSINRVYPDSYSKYGEVYKNNIRESINYVY